MKVPKPRKVSSGNYFIQLRLGGESITVTAPTERECIRKAELIKAEWRNGKKGVVEKKKEVKTVEAVMQDYIDSRSKALSPSTIRGYNTIKDNRFQPFLKKKVSQITDWQKLIDHEIDAGTSGKSIKNAWGFLTSALKHAGYPIPSVKLPQVVSASRPWLDAEQVKTFVAAVQGKECEIPALLALHSLRRSEIMAIKWEKIDTQKWIMSIEGSAVMNAENKLTYKETNKSRKSRRKVPVMIPELRTALSAVPADKRHGYLVKCNPNTLWRQINRICKANGLPKVGVHGLRHSFASLAHHVGLPEQEAMMIGGWEDAQTMHKIYEHISAADKLEAQNKLKDFFEKTENAN